MIKIILVLLSFSFINTLSAQDISKTIDEESQKLRNKLTEWRRHLHQNPELGNREVKTAAYIVEQLKGLDLEIKTGVAKPVLWQF